MKKLIFGLTVTLTVGACAAPQGGGFGGASYPAAENSRQQSVHSPAAQRIFARIKAESREDE